MLVKVCGMREQPNVSDVVSLGISMMGFIFYDRSPRFVGVVAPSTDGEVKRVGVFVNSPISYIKEMVEVNNLDYVQLHGAESRDFCCDVKALNVGVVKAISIADRGDLLAADSYHGVVDYLLFDTKCTGYGGSGISFDWSIIDCYSSATPFLLSGGVDLCMVEQIKQINHPHFAGVDINSKFELSPGVKDIDRISKFLNSINNNE